MDMTVRSPQWDAGRQTYRLLRQGTDCLEETDPGGTGKAEEAAGTGKAAESENGIPNKNETGNKAGESRVFPSRTDVFEGTGSRKEEGIFSRSLFEAVGQPSEDEDSGFQLRSKSQEDSVGQLAAQLARAESRVDVLQVSARATRALMNLKIASASCEGEEAKKIAQKIRRMEKLIKRINKKLKHLSQEEVLENQRKQAEKKKDFQKADELLEELKSRKSKRHKEERKYAQKEIETDAKEENGEMLSAAAGSFGAPDGVSVPDLAGAAMTAAETGVSLDITV